MKKVGDMKTQACLAPSHLAQPTQPPGSLFTRSNAYKNPTLCRTTLWWLILCVYLAVPQCPDTWATIILWGCFWIRLTFKSVDSEQSRFLFIMCWASSNQLKAWIKPKPVLPQWILQQPPSLKCNFNSPLGPQHAGPSCRFWSYQPPWSHASPCTRSLLVLFLWRPCLYLPQASQGHILVVLQVNKNSPFHSSQSQGHCAQPQGS